MPHHTQSRWVLILSNAERTTPPSSIGFHAYADKDALLANSRLGLKMLFTGLSVKRKEWDVHGITLFSRP